MESHLEQQPMSETEGFQESPRKCGAGSVQSANACFDCNICLEFAVDPVVTLCGHLYCWPCMYKWLELESTTPRQCPVCKATLSETTLVPLYGRGKSTGDKASYIDIPRRSSILHRRRGTLATPLVEPDFSQTAALHRRRRHRNASQQQHHHHHIDAAAPQQQPLDVSPLFGSAAVAVLPWFFGENVNVTTGPPYSNRYHLVGDAGSQGQRRQEMLARRSLHRIFVFLFCCTVLCLILF